MQAIPSPRKKYLPAAVQQKLAAGESETLDFKIEISSPIKIARTLVAFANHKGGTILVGVDDDKSLRGVQPEEELHMLDLAATGFCKPAIRLDIKEHPMKKKSILEAVVPEGDQKPYYALGEDDKWWAYIRVEDRSMLASKVMLEVIKRKALEEQTLIEYTAREKKLLEYLSKHDSITLRQYCKMALVPRKPAQHILVNLASIGMLRIHTDGNEERYSLAQKT